MASTWPHIAFPKASQGAFKEKFLHLYMHHPPNFSSLQQNLSEKDSISIKLVELQLPTLPELPPHLHTTNGLPPHLIPTLKKSLVMAKPNFHNILQSLKPDFVLYEFIQPWAQQWPPPKIFRLCCSFAPVQHQLLFTSSIA